MLDYELISKLFEFTSIDKVTILFNNCSYKVNTAFAIALSPKIYELKKHNPCLSYIRFNYTITNNEFIKLIHGKKISLKGTYDFGKLLCNKSLLQIYYEQNEKLDLTTIYDDIKAIEADGLTPTAELDYLCSNFESWYRIYGKYHNIDPNIMIEIITNPNLSLESEESVWLFIKQAIDGNELDENIKNTLLRSIHLECLSEKSFYEFINYIDAFCVTPSIWSTIHMRLIKESKKDYDIPPDFGSVPWKGLIYDLTNESGGNVIDNGTINIFCSSVGFGNVRNLVDFSTHQIFFPADRPQQYLTFSFNKMFSFIGYSIRRNDKRGESTISSWRLEGMDNQTNEWILLDKQEHNFSVKNNANGFLGLFNPIQTTCLRLVFEKNEIGNYCSCFSNIEFYINK